MSELTLPQAMDLAISHHLAGRFHEAELLYRRILAADPRHSDAMHLLGVLAHQIGRHDDAVQLVRQAIQLKPSAVEYHSNLGVILAAIGRFEDATAEYRKAVSLRPDQPEGHYSLAHTYQVWGRLEESLAAYDAAIALRPGFPDAQNNRGMVLQRLGRLEDALAAFRRTLAIQPDYADAHYNLGNVLHELGRSSEAIESYHRALALRPKFPDAQMNRGNALRKLGRLDESIAAFKSALSQRPDSADTHTNLGIALQEKGEFNEAIAEHQRAIALRPQFPEAFTNLGSVLREKGDFDEAIRAFQRALEARPGYPEARWNLGLLRLLKGELAEGWELYETRWELRQGFPAIRLMEPLWDGSELAGRRIVLHSEQGFGDTIQFARYAPMVASRGGRVTIVCQPPLERLLRTVDGVETVISDPAAIPQFDLRCPLMSLPRVFGTRLESIPAAIPYLSAEAALVRGWTERFAAEPRGLKVGLVWAGSRTSTNDRTRSIAPTELLPLGGIPGIRFYSLQKPDPARPALTTPPPFEVVDWTRQLHDFADTAALIRHLDLVISVDTAVAHLSGALGRPVWVLLPFAPDWRWLLNRTDSPWYPTARLFRQPGPRDWQTPIRRMAEELVALLHRK